MTSARGVRALALLVTSALTMAARCSNPPPTPCPPLPVPPPITDEIRDRAMLSITVHALVGRHEIPRGLAPDSLPVAVAVLAGDDDRLAPARRRRAIAWLTGQRLGEPSID